MSYCVVVDKELAISHCPLPKGICFFKHRKTGLCSYQPDVTKMTHEELANLVGVIPLTEAEFQEQVEELRVYLSTN